MLAFANGAPDIIASATAAGGDDGIFISVGGLFGACIFGSTVVLGYCVYKSESAVEMPPMEWIRDLSFYILTAVVVLIYGCIGTVNLTMALSFFGIYILYFTIVMIVSKIFPNF